MELGLKAHHPLATGTCETRALRVPCGYPEFSSVHPAPKLGFVVQGGAHKIKSEDMSTLHPSWTILNLLSPFVPICKSGPLSNSQCWAAVC